MQEQNPRHACTKKIHAPQLACAKRRMHPLDARSRDTRATALMRASKACARRPLLACAKDGRANGRACKDARVAAIRIAKMRASGQLQELRPSLHASVLPAMFSPTIRRNVKGGWAIKRASPPPMQAPGHFLPQATLHLLPTTPLQLL